MRAGEGDSGLISELKSAELVSIAAAERTLGGLGAAQRRTVRRLRAQDQEHAAALTTVLAGFGIEPEAALPPAPGPVLAAAGAVRRARRGRRRLAALLALEEAVAAAYRDALPVVVHTSSFEGIDVYRNRSAAPDRRGANVV